MDKNLVVTGWVFARGGSKGVVRKNLREVGGTPLLGHSIRALQASTSIGRVLVSTDDEEIATVARTFGAEVPFLRPHHLAGDNASEWDAWRHAMQWLVEQEPRVEHHALVSAPCTSPLRVPEDIDRCYQILLESGADAAVMGSPAHRSPYFNMVKFRDDGFIETVIQSEGIVRRQDAPDLFDLTTVAYAATREHILTSPSLYKGRVALALVDIERSMDIDTEWDLKLANLIWESERNRAV